MSQSSAESRRAVCSTRPASTFTPIEKLPDLTMGMLRDASRISALCACENPVAPITRAGRPLAAARIASSVDAAGDEKSMMTSVVESASSRVARGKSAAGASAGS
jgi:hypothetical protein